jgi:hypothetical protein
VQASTGTVLWRVKVRGWSHVRSVSWRPGDCAFAVYEAVLTHDGRQDSSGIRDDVVPSSNKKLSQDLWLAYEDLRWHVTWRITLYSISICAMQHTTHLTVVSTVWLTH